MLGLLENMSISLGIRSLLGNATLSWVVFVNVSPHISSARIPTTSSTDLFGYVARVVCNVDILSCVQIIINSCT